MVEDFSTKAKIETGFSLRENYFLSDDTYVGYRT